MYTAIEQYPNSTNNELAKILDWPINWITGRVNELRNPDKHGRWVSPVVIYGPKRRCKITGDNYRWEVEKPIEPKGEEFAEFEIIARRS